MRTRLIGLPGTGKTTKLLEILDQLLLNYPASEIVYCSFSNAAVNEAKERVLRRFQIDEAELKYFRTMHSLCLRLLSLKKQIMGGKPAKQSDFKFFLEQFLKSHTMVSEFVEQIAIEVAVKEQYYTRDQRTEIISEYTLGTKPEKFFLHVFEFMKSKYGVTILQPKKFTKFRADFERTCGISEEYRSKLYTSLYLLEKGWIAFMERENLFTFSDLLVKVFQQNISPNAKILIVDEYQDSSKLQAQLIDMWSERMDKTIIAGDPNQSIYGFNGASPKYLENFPSNEEILLAKTWRCPQAVVSYAKEILPNSWTKEMIAASDKRGRVFETTFEHIPYQEYSSIYILGRTNSILEEARKQMRALGIVQAGENTSIVQAIYTLQQQLKDDRISSNCIYDLIELGYEHCKSIFDANTFQALKEMKLSGETFSINRDKFLNMTNSKSENQLKLLLRNKMNLEQRELLEIMKKQPEFSNQLEGINIEFMTIHASKGREAELVIILDAASWFELNEVTDEDEEERLYFVAATRSKRDIAIIALENYERTKFLPYAPDNLNIETIV